MKSDILEKLIENVRYKFPEKDLGELPDWLDLGQEHYQIRLDDIGIPMSNSETFYPLGSPVEGGFFDHAIGLDVLAWYVTFRRDSKWGIYIRERGIETIAKVLNSVIQDPSVSRELAFDALLEHELTHFRVDATIGGSEMLCNKSLFSPWRKAKTSLPWSDLEESLCNSHMLDVVPASARKALASWFRSSPHGYKDFDQHKRTPMGREISWSSMMTEVSSTLDFSQIGFIRNSKAVRTVPPIFIVKEKDIEGMRGTSFALLGALSVTETSEFTKKLLKLADQKCGKKNWLRAKGFLESGQPSNGLNIEKYSSDIYTIRLSKQCRAILRRTGANSVDVIDIDIQHDAINKRARMLR